MAAAAKCESSLREELKSVRTDLHAREGRIRDQEQERSVVEQALRLSQESLAKLHREQLEGQAKL